MQAKKSLKEKMVAVHEAHVEEEITTRREQQAIVNHDALVMIIGGIRAVHSVSEALASQSIRALQRVRDEELYKSEGFHRFDEFLDQSPLSPMSYRKFNRMETALLNEGDELFDYLNSINAPMAKRRLLGKGTLAVEGEEIIIRQDKEEQRFPISSRAVMLTTLSKLADQNNEQRRTINRGVKENLKLKKKLDAALQAKWTDTIVSKNFDDCLWSVITALGALATRVADLTPAEAEAARFRVLELVSAPYQKLQEAFLAHEGKQTKRAARAASLTDNITQADLESLMET